MDDETESILFLTNMSGQTARIGFSVTANGVHYYLTKLKLDPHQTKAIDIRKLRDKQQADFKKNKIPAGASDGSVNWVRVDNVPVMGRLLVIQRHKGVASNYDCNQCGCPTSYFSTEISPSPVDLLPGSYMNCALTEVTTSCNGTFYYANVTTTAAWSTADTSIATMDSGVAGKVYATTKGGTTSIITSYRAYTYVYANHICNASPASGGGIFQCSVQKPGYLQVNFSDTLPECTNNSSCETGISYSVLDSEIPPQPIHIAGMKIAESLQFTSNTCGSFNDSGTWTTGSLGQMLNPPSDGIDPGCYSKDCAAQFNQTFTVNGTSVSIMSEDGKTVGSKNVISFSCKSGTCSCPLVTITN